MFPGSAIHTSVIQCQHTSFSNISQLSASLKNTHWQDTVLLCASIFRIMPHITPELTQSSNFYLCLRKVIHNSVSIAELCFCFASVQGAFHLQVEVSSLCVLRSWCYNVPWFSLRYCHVSTITLYRTVLPSQTYKSGLKMWFTGKTRKKLEFNYGTKKNLSTKTPCAPPTQASLLLNPLTTDDFISVILPFPECHGKKRKRR